MSRTTLPLLLLLGLSAPALAQELPGSTNLPETDHGPSDLRIGVLGGAFDGLGVRRGSGGLALFQADWTPRLRADDWAFAFPLGFSHRQTFGASLRETVADVGADAAYVQKTFETGPLAGYSYTWRPDWPDLYQPNGSGGLLPTDRYTHSRWFVGYRHWSKFGEGRHFRAKARWIQYSYVRDPHYDPAVSRVHLVPRDYHEARLDLSYRQVKHAYAWALRLDAYARGYDVMLARVADTGGVRSSDPKQQLRGVEPRAEVELRSRPLTLTVGYGFMARSDPFQGYYSYTGHHPYVEAKGKLTRALSYEAKASGKFLTYGPNSKSITRDAIAGVYVPGTDDGRRLFDSRVELEAVLRYRVIGDFSLVAEASWVKRATNYRDYVPGVYPPPLLNPKPYDTNYDIRWDYTNTMVVGGIEWRP